MSQSNVSESRVVADPRRWWALAATATTVLVIGLDTTILNVALPDIAVSLHATERPAPVVRRQLPAGAGCVAAARRGCSATGTDGSARRWSGWSCSSSARSGARSRRAPRVSSPPGRCSGSVPRSSSHSRCRRSSCCSRPRSAPGRSRRWASRRWSGCRWGRSWRACCSSTSGGVRCSSSTCRSSRSPWSRCCSSCPRRSVPAVAGWTWSAYSSPPSGCSRRRTASSRGRSAGGPIRWCWPDWSVARRRSGRSCGGSDATAVSSRSSTRCCGGSRRSGGVP